MNSIFQMYNQEGHSNLRELQEQKRRGMKYQVVLQCVVGGGVESIYTYLLHSSYERSRWNPYQKYMSYQLDSWEKWSHVYVTSLQAIYTHYTTHLNLPRPAPRNTVHYKELTLKSLL